MCNFENYIQATEFFYLKNNIVTKNRKGTN
jgi:hypothetical protein